MINFAEYRSILCLDGTLPDADFFKSGLPVIAADGAANKLVEMGIEPSLVVGDLDSIHPALLNRLKTILYHDQNLCDFDKALEVMETQKLLPCIIVGINGGYLDHILNNINILMRSSNCLYAPPLVGYVVHENESRSFELPLNTKISLFGIPTAEVSTHGLKWELTHSPLSFPGRTSCSNRTLKSEINILTHKGSILVLIY